MKSSSDLQKIEHLIAHEKLEGLTYRDHWRVYQSLERIRLNADCEGDQSFTRSPHFKNQNRTFLLIRQSLRIRTASVEAAWTLDLAHRETQPERLPEEVVQLHLPLSEEREDVRRRMQDSPVALHTYNTLLRHADRMSVGGKTGHNRPLSIFQKAYEDATELLGHHWSSIALLGTYDRMKECVGRGVVYTDEDIEAIRENVLEGHRKFKEKLIEEDALVEPLLLHGSRLVRERCSHLFGRMEKLRATHHSLVETVI